ncbi:hypothetical protein LQZ19_11850 [Treponema primitia]|uniref:hypothetical protein n=1 Tax=Treponema primitia TaxID=88058 RepID=UPI0039801F5F
MENFGSFLPILILIVVGGARILATVRRKARNRDQTRKPEEASQPFRTASPQKTDRGFHPWEDEYRDPSSSVTVEGAEQKVRQAPQADNDDEEEFSAWSLSVDEETPKPAPAATPKPGELSAKLSAVLSTKVPADTNPASVFTALSVTSAVSVSGEIPAWLQSPSQPEARQAEVPASDVTAPKPSAPEAAAADSGTSGGVPRKSGALSRIRSLPPLQQGIVWAEILGAPKGL